MLLRSIFAQNCRSLRSIRMDLPDTTADMIAEASKTSEVWIVTHSAQLAEGVRERYGVRQRTVIRDNGATWIEGMRLTGVIAGESDDED